MIARVGVFEHLGAEALAASRRNLLDRFLPALRAQPGFVAGYWLAGEGGAQLSITFWESEQAMQEGGQRANATPLLPGQDPAAIPSPDRTKVYEVVAHAAGAGRP